MPFVIFTTKLRKNERNFKCYHCINFSVRFYPLCCVDIGMAFGCVFFLGITELGIECDLATFKSINVIKIVYTVGANHFKSKLLKKIKIALALSAKLHRLALFHTNDSPVDFAANQLLEIILCCHFIVTFVNM